MDGGGGAGAVAHVRNQGFFVLHFDEKSVIGCALVVQGLETIDS